MRDPDVHDPATIHPDSPLGRALLGSKVGDEVVVRLSPALPNRRLTIMAVE